MRSAFAAGCSVLLSRSQFYQWSSPPILHTPPIFCALKSPAAIAPCATMAVTRSKRSAASGKKSGPSKGKVEKPGAKGAGSSKAKTTKAKSSAEELQRDKDGVAYFYFRSEPTTRMVNGVDVKFSIADLAAEPSATATWDGVRNYTARNWMREMKVGDKGFFYHSNTSPDAVGIVGTVTVVKEAYPDNTAWDPRSPYYDPRSTEENPKWDMVEVKLDETFDKCVTRESLKHGPLHQAYLIRMGRVSVGPVLPAHWEAIMEMAKEEKIEEAGKDEKKPKEKDGEEAEK